MSATLCTCGRVKTTKAHRCADCRRTYRALYNQQHQREHPRLYRPLKSDLSSAEIESIIVREQAKKRQTRWSA